MKILVLHGPNLNLLGERDPEIYGNASLPELNKKIEAWARGLNMIVDIRQSNHEGELIDWIHESRTLASGIVLNAGALTHTSQALRDAIDAVGVPTVEVHLSNIHAREEFRKVSMIAPACIGSISGFKELSYHLALIALKELGLTRLKVV